MKKTISILLCLILLLSCVSIFSSCARYTGIPSVTRKKIDIDLTGYELTYLEDVSVSAQQEIRDFAKLFQQKTGVAVMTNKTDPDVSISPSKQILVGNIPCAPTEKALKDIDGHGWTIRVIDDNIVIVGTTQLFTNMAMDYFAEHYLQIAEGATVKSTTISVNKKVLLEKVPTVDVVGGGEYNYAFIYSEELDDEIGWNHVIPGNHSGGASKDDIDFPVALAQERLPDILANALKAKNYPDYWSDKKICEKEILVGMTNRPESYECMKTLSADEYGIFVRGNKIVLGAWNDEALEFAVQMFEKHVTDAYYKDEEGNESIVFPAEYTDTGLLDSDWVTDFPKPDGDEIKLVSTLSSGDDSLIYSYRGAGVTVDAFEVYCSKLVRNGYVLVQSNTIEQNKFATYKNTAENTTLHVEFASYAYADTMSVTNTIAKTYVEDFAPTLRITSAPLTSVTLPTDELLNAGAITSVNAITDSMITQVNVDYTAGDKGMFYIITLQDGTFIVVDGATNRNGLDDKLWKTLKILYKKAHGYEATAKDSIHIRAWLLTHEHSDHYTVLYHFLRDYGKNDLLRFDYLLANFTSETQDYNAMQPSHYIYNNLSRLQGYCPAGEAFQYIKVHAGQKLYVGNVMLEVLYTHEDIAPGRQYFFNDTSTVFKTTIYNVKNGTVKNQETFMILGDAALITSTFLRACYTAETLNVDQVQVAHHGGFGCEWQLYTLMSPTATWWALDARTTNNTCAVSNKNKGLEYTVGNYLMNEIAGHLYAYIADEYAVTLTLTQNGPLYDKLWDANSDYVENQYIVYDDYCVIDVTERRS